MSLATTNACDKPNIFYSISILLESSNRGIVLQDYCAIDLVIWSDHMKASFVVAALVIRSVSLSTPVEASSITLDSKWLHQFMPALPPGIIMLAWT